MRMCMKIIYHMKGHIFLHRTEEILNPIKLVKVEIFVSYFELITYNMFVGWTICLKLLAE
jgi:hypothetical protein